MQVKRLSASIALLSLALLLAGCGTAPKEVFSIDSIQSYHDIPGVTDQEKALIEELKASYQSFSYGQMYETEAFMLPDGTYVGFTSKLCALLSELFGISFVQELHDWDSLTSGLEEMRIDFTGDLTATAERMRVFYMTRPIAERTQRIFTAGGTNGIVTEKDVNGLNIGFLEGAVDAEATRRYYPDLTFNSVSVPSFAAAAYMLDTGEIDAFVSEGVIDPIFDEYGFIYSREFFPLVYTPVSMTTANPKLEVIISVFDKYLSAGGIDRLYEFYREGEAEYARYKLNKSFSGEELAYLDNLRASGGTVKIALETDNYPVSFYNNADKEFQGIAPDVLDEISRFIGVEFENVNDGGVSWSEILEMLRENRISMVSQLLYSDIRKDDFIWADAPYATTSYALLSKSGFSNIASYQVARAKVGVINKSAFEDKYGEWFPDNDNAVGYNSQDEALQALENGEVDLLMASYYVLLMQLNYREKLGYKVNIHFDMPMDSSFGFSKNETVLRSIISKSQDFVKTSLIADDWTSRVYDYSKTLAKQRLIYMMIIIFVLMLVLVLTFMLLMRNRKFNLSLKLLVSKRTYELERQTQAAQVASKAKSAFLARMSHEIRTPMNAIIGMAGIAEKSISNPEKSLASINQIIASSRHLLGILNDVLDMSKIESGKLELSLEPFRLLRAHREVTAMIEQRCNEKGINFHTNLDEIPDISLKGDKLRLNQVLINLLGNAVKFTGKAGDVFFLVRILEETGDSAFIRFSVSDNGIGMSGDQIKRLFVPFEQADSTIAAKFGGTGLGLSISHNLVEKMGGAIKVESAPGSGSTFYFELYFDKCETVDDADEPACDCLDLRGKRILLAEDVEVNRLIVREILSESGVEIDEAENGLLALELFKASPPYYYDLLFMDIQMPAMDGYETTRSIRSLERPDAREIPIIAMTANAYSEDVEEALASGMNGHLSKPIDVGALMKTLAELSGVKARP